MNIQRVIYWAIGGMGILMLSSYLSCKFSIFYPEVTLGLSFLLLGVIWALLHLSVFVPIHKINVKAEEYLQGEREWSYVPPKSPVTRTIHAFFTHLINDFKKASDFITEIEKGNLHVQLAEDKNNYLRKNHLSGSLISLRDKLNELEQEEGKRKWATKGLAQFVDILQTNNNDLNSLCHKITSETVKYLNANQGWLYLVELDREDKPYLELKACYAWDRQKYVKKRIDLGEGLAGQVLFEKKTIHVNNIPNQYLQIASGTGTANPTAILIIPLKVNEEIKGVIELASFTDFEPYQIEFLEKLCENIAASISSIRVTEQTKDLLEQSQIQGEQLRAQEEEMRQNMEELQATQETLLHQQREQEQLSSELEKEKSLFDTFLKNTSDLIYFKNRKSQFIRISDSMLGNFRTSNMDDVIGKTDFDFFSHDHAQKAYNDEQKIVETGKPMLNMEERESWDDGTVEWSDTSKMPLYSTDGAIIGTFGVSRKITERKLTEEALAKEKQLLESFLHNTPQMVYFKDQEGHYIKASKALAKFLGLNNPDELIGKTDFEFMSFKAAKNNAEQEKQVLQNTQPILNLTLNEQWLNGKSFEMITHKFPITALEGNLIGILGIYETVK
jgi:methyl-accepting chemotaxis protein